MELSGFFSFYDCTFVGFNWTLVESCYLGNAPSTTHVNKWRNFLSSLGVIDFLAVKKKDVTLKLSELVNISFGLTGNILLIMYQ